MIKERAVRLFNSGDHLTIEALSQTLGINIAQARNAIKQLRMEKIICRIGEDAPAVYMKCVDQGPVARIETASLDHLPVHEAAKIGVPASVWALGVRQ